LLQPHANHTGQDELSLLRETIKAKELKYKGCKATYDTALSECDAAIEAQMKVHAVAGQSASPIPPLTILTAQCEMEINALTSTGGHLANPKQFFELATSRGTLTGSFPSDTTCICTASFTFSAACAIAEPCRGRGKVSRAQGDGRPPAEGDVRQLRRQVVLRPPALIIHSLRESYSLELQIKDKVRSLAM
jgi:hypothetical protein